MLVLCGVPMCAATPNVDIGVAAGTRDDGGIDAAGTVATGCVVVAGMHAVLRLYLRVVLRREMPLPQCADHICQSLGAAPCPPIALPPMPDGVCTWRHA